ncbi:MAG: T9SS C-terminal target domain-containing protein, partial [Chitinophagia bacterium]|nr:T9SS C-terminal target domain-containing protein [Chitinophagia bacterium]
GVGAPTVKSTHQQAATLQVYPNPVRDWASIIATLPLDGPVTLTITDMMGCTVATVANGQWSPAGSHQWAINRQSTMLQSGVYLLHLQGEAFATTMRLLVEN